MGAPRRTNPPAKDYIGRPVLAAFPMYVLPLVELRGGESVHVLPGPSLGEGRPLIDPVEVATRFAALGAQGFHVVDVDRAASPDRDNDAALLSILDHTTLPVEAGGGVRSLRRIQELLDTGVRRVLVGSMGVLHADWLREAALLFPDRLVACVDTTGDDVWVKGRTEPAATTLSSFLASAEGVGLHALHLTFLGKNGGGVDLMRRLVRTTRIPLSYQGPVSGPADLAALDEAGVRGVALGEEVYDGRLSFQELAKRYRVS